MSTRKIKDAKDLSTNELIYFKGHAKATYMSDGTTVEDAINNIEVTGGVVDTSNFVQYYNNKEINATRIHGEYATFIDIDKYGLIFGPSSKNTYVTVHAEGDGTKFLSDNGNYKELNIPTKVSELENDVPYIVDDVVSDGVYAVDANGKLIDYNLADTTATGVALVAGEHKFMIAKSDATDGTNTTLYWGKNLYQKDVAGITNISSGAGYIGEGKKYGTDFTTWSTGPVVDFNGAANTAAIIAGYTEHGVSMDARDMCTVLNTFNASDSYNDWYVPACGQLALMYLAKNDINAALAKIGGTAFESSYYWSSSESGAYGAWFVHFGNGYVNSYDKNNDYGIYRVRFVRDISVSKPLKERVSDLESSNGAYKEINHGTGDTTFTLTPNTFHVWDEVTSLDLSFADEQTGVANEYLFQFTSGTTATTLTLPDGLKWTNELIISPNTIFQVSVLKGLASVLSWDNSKSVFPASLVEGDNGEIGVNVYQELKKHIQLKEGDLTLTINGTSYSIISYEKDYDYTNDGFLLLTINSGPKVIYYILEESGNVIDFIS